MQTKAIERLLKHRPFQPFRVVMSSGEDYTVYHPENAVLMKEGMFIAFPTKQIEDRPDDFAICSYLHIATLQPVETAKGINQI